MVGFSHSNSFGWWEDNEHKRIQRGDSMSIRITTVPRCLKSHGGNVAADTGRSGTHSVGLCNSWGTQMLTYPRSYNGLLAAHPFIPPETLSLLSWKVRENSQWCGKRCLYFTSLSPKKGKIISFMVRSPILKNGIFDYGIFRIIKPHSIF